MYQIYSLVIVINLEYSFFESISKLLESRWGGERLGVWRLVGRSCGDWGLGGGDMIIRDDGCYDTIFEFSIRDSVFKITIFETNI